MADNIFDPLSRTGQLVSGVSPAMVPPAETDPAAYRSPAVPVNDLSGRTKVKFVEPENPLAVRFGSTADPLQLDMDPFGRNTVEWGRTHGQDLPLDYIKSANVFGHVMSREQLEASEKGRRLKSLMEDTRNGRQRGFWDAITDVSIADLPFFGMFATVGNSVKDAMVVHETLDKIQRGEYVTEEEALTTRLYMAEQEAQSQHTWGAVVGDIVRAAPGFMGEFALSNLLLKGARSAVGKAASGSAQTAARLSLDRFTKYTARGLVESGFAKAIAGPSGTATDAAMRAGWQNVSAATKSAVRQSTVKALAPLVKEQLGATAEMAEKVAGARADIEIARALARNSSKSGVVRWLNGTAQAALDHVSRGLLDFGHYGTEVYSASGKELGSALTTLGHAIGALGPEALVRGALIGLPQAAVVKPLVGALYDGKVVSPQQLALEAAAVRTGNRDLFNSAEAYAAGLNLAEYVSESAGRGFGLMFRSAGLGLFGAKAMGVASGTAGLLPKGVAEEAGSAVRRWIAKAVGSTDDMVHGHLAAEVEAVSRKLGGSVPRNAVETFVRTGETSVLGETASAVGAKPREFIANAVKEAIAADRNALSYRTYWRYVLADKMLQMGWGPDQMTNWLRHAGYDGIVEEMMEERYNDFAKGLFGLDDRAAKDKGFLKNIRQAFDNLKVGWEQLTAEAVGFAVPLGARVAVDSIHRAAGGSDLSYVQRYASATREFRGANNIVEMKGGDYFRIASEEIGRLRSRLTGKDAEGNPLKDGQGNDVVGLEAQLEERRGKLKAEGATDEMIDRETAELREEIRDVQNRISTAEAQVAKQRSVEGAAEYDANAILAFEATNTTGESTGGDVPTPEQAHRGVAAKDAIVEGAARAGEILARAKVDAVDPKTMPLGSRIIHRITNVLGAIVTGDIAMAMEDPMAWAMVDRGMDRTIVGRLAEAYNSHFDATKARLMREGKSAPSNDEVRDAMRAGYEAEARSVAQSWLAAQGIRIFSSGEMLEQARGVVMDRHDGTLDGHEDEVDQVRDQIAERALRILSGGALQSADVGRIARGVISLPDDSPLLDDKIVDATLRLSGFRGLEQVVELRPDTDLRSVIGARTVDSALVVDIAKMDLADLKPGQQEILQRVAAQLHYTPNYDASGKNAAAFTDEAIARMNQRVQRLCKLALASANPHIRVYRKAADSLEFSAPGRAGSGDFIRVVQDGKGFHWTETVEETGMQVQRTAASEAELDAAMGHTGFKRVSTPVTFVQAREIRAKDPAVMLQQLGLTSRYIAVMAAGKERDALSVDNHVVHPALRERIDADGTPVRIPYEDAQRIFRDELSQALRFREVMSLSESERIEAFRNSADEKDAAIIKRINDAEFYYKSVFGSEQGQEGYLPVMEKVLRSAGVELPGAESRSYSRYLAGQDGYYTLNTRLLNFHGGEAYVLVDLNRDIDYDGAILSRAISNGLVAFRDLWAYDGDTGTYPAFSAVVRDMARRLDRVAVDLAHESNAAGRPGEARDMMNLLEEIMGGSNVDRPRLDAIVWIIRNAVFGQAMREAAASKSTTANVAAAARLAQALRQTQEFWPFLGFADLVLGGSGFAGPAKQKGAATFGVARLAAEFSGNPNYMVEDLLNGMLPVKHSGKRMTAQEFMDLVNRTLANRSKSSAQTAKGKAAQEFDQDALQFIRELKETARLSSYEDLKDFMAEVLQMAGIRAGNTEDLKNWRSTVEHARVYREALETERANLQGQIDELEAKLTQMRTSREPGSQDRVQDLLAQIDTLKAQLNQQKREASGSGTVEEGESDAGVSAAAGEAETGSEGESEAGAGAEYAQSPSLDEDPLAYDPDSDLGADGIEIAPSYEVPPAAGDTVRVDATDDSGNTVSGEVKLPDPLSMTPEGLRHVMWTVVSAMRATGVDSSPESFTDTLRALFPSPVMSEADVDKVKAEYAARETEAAGKARDSDEMVLDLVMQELDDYASEVKDYDAWTKKAVRAYESLSPMLEMMEAALPLAKRNFQGLVGYLRADVAQRLRGFQETDMSELAMAYRLVDELLSPRRSAYGKTYAERLAFHRATLSRTFDDRDGKSDETLGALVRAFTARVTLESGVRQMENAPLAAFISFLASLRSAGTRQSIALLCSSSTACSAVSVGNVVKTYSRETAIGAYDPLKEGTTFRSSDLQVNSSITTRGSVSVGMAVAPFAPLADMNQGKLAVVGRKFADLATEAAKTMVPLAFAAPDYGFAYEESPGSGDAAADAVRGSTGPRIYTGAPRGMLLQDIETFRRNAETMAGVLDKVFGQGNSLSRVLTSPMLFDRLRARALRSDDLRGLIQLRRAMMMFAPDGQGRVRALGMVRSVLLRLYDESKTTSGVGRARLADIVQTAFTTGNLEESSLSFPGSDAGTADQWAYLFNEAVQSMPDTVVPAKKVQYRTTKDSSVAVAAPGMIPIAVRYMTVQDDRTATAFRTLCESIVREAAVRDYWMDKGIELGGYINPKDPVRGLDSLLGRKQEELEKELELRRAEQYMDEYVAAKGIDSPRAASDAPIDLEDLKKQKKRMLDEAQGAADARIAELGGIDAIVDRCLDTMTWPDEAHTPIVARNLSVDYSPAELGRACSYTYANGTGLWYVPLFGGDHSCNNLLQVPAARLKSGDDLAKAYLKAARAVNDSLGVTMMMADTKRSAITSADAAAVPMVGCEVTWSADAIPQPVSVKFGEARHHLILNFAKDGGEDYSQEAAHGQTVCAGFGAEALRDSAKDPQLRISKFHALGTGYWLEFRKSAVTLVSESGLEDGGADAPGTMVRAMSDYALGYRTEKSRMSSTDQVTDEDSYKVGPLKSAIYQVATGEADASGRVPGETVLSYVKRLLKSGTKPEKVLEQEVRMVSRAKSPNGELSKPMKLSEALDGLDIREVKGLHAGDSQTPAAFAISYRDNSVLALKVANIAHRAKPHLGSNGKNYTIDALAKAVEQTVRKGVGLSDPRAITQNQVITTLNAWAILGSAVATDPVSVELELADDPRLQTLKANGADPRGLEYRRLRAETVAKRIRKSMLAPLSKVDATLTACGATLSKTGRLLDHTVCPMRRDVHGGSVVFGADETADGALYAGFKRRFADAEVNVQASWFRYGMFLDPSLEGYGKLFGGLDGADLMQEMDNIVRSIYVADTKYDQELRKYREALAADRRAGVRTLRLEPPSLLDARKERNTMRKAFLSCFTDHHGVCMADKKLKAVMKGKTVWLEAWRLVSFGDLMVSDGNGGTRFDRTAFRMGDDGVHRAVYKASGELDESLSSKGKMMYLAGTAFGVPRTPSYNGGAWLQVVRASFPVRETYVDGVWNVGPDAVVALDPFTRDEILGCDNDGDESALFMFSPNESGYVPVGDVEQCLPDMDLSTWDHTFASGSALESKKNRSAMLSNACTVNVDGVRYVKRTGDAFEVTPAGQRAVSNQLVQGLISMAHDLEVPPGDSRRAFASEVSGRTKAQPFDDARWWKRTKDEAPGFEGRTRLMDIMPPDVIQDGQTIGDPDLQEKVSLSAKKSAKARAMIVSAAGALHTAYISGCFGGTGVDSPYSLFGPEFTPDGWQAFMRHFDGLSNATFDDVKERICARLGLTPEMIDTLVVDLLNRPRPPQTDEEWYEALASYVMSVRDRLPDGTPVWVPSAHSDISATDDKSRMFMAGVSDEYGDDWSRLASTALFGGGGTKDARRDGLLKAFGLTRVTQPGDGGSVGYVIDAKNAPENSARRVLGRFLLSDPRLTAGIIEAALERGGRNPVAGYLLWLGGAGCGNLSKFADGKADDLSTLRTVLQTHGEEFKRFFAKRRAWMKAKDFAHAINYTQVDPGSPTAYRTVERANKAYADVMAVMYAKLTPDRQKLVQHMRQATRMGYSCGMVNAGTPGARAHEAAETVQETPMMNADIIEELQRRGDIASAADARAVQDAVVRAAASDGLVDMYDRDALQDNMTSIPYVIAAIQSLPRTGFTKDVDTTRRFLEALAGYDDKPGLRIFGLRNTIESMFRVMYALAATADEGIDHPGLLFFRMTNDRAFMRSDELKHREGRTVRSSYGLEKEKLELSTVSPRFASNNQASMARMRNALADLGHRGKREGALDKATRHFRNKDEKLARYLVAKSFNITRQNLIDTKSEAVSAKKTGSRNTADSLIRAVEVVDNALDRVAKAMHMDTDKVTITVSDMVDKLLPLYSAIVTPVYGTPSYDQFSNSILAMLPGVYSTWSKRQADNDAAYEAMRSRMPRQDARAVGFVDCLAALRFAPVDYDSTSRKLSGLVADSVTLPAVLDMVANSRPDRIAEPVRQNPEDRTLVDLFAYDGVLFKAAKLHDAMSAAATSWSAKTPAEEPVAEAENALPAEERASDHTFARLSESLRTMLSSIPGLTVETDGNTMVVTGTISGDAALKRRGIAKPVRTVIRIDLCQSGFGATAADLNSPANAASITNALREAGIVDISPENFLTKLSFGEREALVRRVMPEALAKAGTGYALRTPSWQIDSEGILTLAGAIKLRKADNRVMFHEYFHSMVGMMRSLGMFTGGERAALEKAFGKARNQGELFDEERAADMFADYVMKRRAKASAKGPVASFLKRILDFVKRLLAVMQAKGFHYGENLKVGTASVSGRELLFNMVLSGQAMDSLDSAKIVKTRLDAAHRAQEGIAQDAAAARLDAALSKLHEDRFQKTRDAMAPDAAAVAKDRLLETRNIAALAMDPVDSFQSIVDGAIRARGGTVASERGGDTAQPAQPLSLDALSAEVAANFSAVPPGNGITGETTSGAGRLSQMGHAIAQAIADGMDAVDPAVRGLLESHSDLSQIHYRSKLADVTTEAVYDVVNRGLFSAAETLGVDLKAKDQTVKNIVYANMILLYDDLALQLGYGGRKNAIRLAREHKGELVRRKGFITRHDVAALILTAGGLSYDDIAKDAYATFAELRREAKGHPGLTRAIAHLERNLRRIVAKTSYKGDPIHEIEAGVKMGERDLETGVVADAVEDTGATSRTALRNRRMYMFDDRRFQRAFKTAVRTAYTLAAAKKLYQVLGIEESQLKDNVRVPGGFGDRVKVRDRRLARTKADGGATRTATLPDGTQINFAAEGHEYYSIAEDGSRVDYAPVTSLVDAFTNAFDAVRQSRSMRRTEEEAAALRDEWNAEKEESARRGTLIHSVYEDVLAGRPVRVQATDEREREMFRRATEIAQRILRDYEVLGTEVIVADPHGSGVAGTIDCLARNRHTGRLTIIDHKTSKHILDMAYGDLMMLDGLSRLPDSKFNHYALQLNLYRELLRRGGVQGVNIAGGEPIDLVINLYNGYSDQELEKIAEHVDHVYRKTAADVRTRNLANIKRERWITDVPDLEDEVSALLAYAKGNRDAVVENAVPEAQIPRPVPAAEVVNALGMSINDLLDDRTVFDPFAEVGLYINNPGEWLASTVRAKFGGKPLRELFTEHGDLEAASKRFHHVMNWWAMYLGENFTEGHKLLAVKKDKGHFIMEDGHVSYDETGHERIGFDNYHYRALGMDRLHGSTVDVTLDRSDKELIDFWLKAAYFRAMHDRYMLTGIDGVYITYGDMQKSDGSSWSAADFTAEKVLGRYNGSHVGRQLSKIDVMLAEVLSENQLPAFVRGSGAGQIGLYDSLVKGVVDTLNEMRRAYSARGSNLSPALANRMFLEGMAKRGLMKYTVDHKGVPAHGVVTVPVDRIESHWRQSQTYRKLVKAGRDENMLTMDAVTASARSAYAECQRIMRKNPWMAEGDGRHFNTMGSMMPFFAGGGVFMYYANRIGRDAKKDVSQRLNEYEESFLRALQSPDGDATDGQLMMLHDYFKTGTDAGQALRTAIAKGEYVEGSAKALKTGLVAAPEDLAHSHRVAEIIYRRLCEISWAQERHADLVELSGGRGSVARMLDFYAQTAGEYTGWAAAGMNATQMYELNGVLPANFQIFHAVNVKLQDAARTAQFRNTFVGFLFSSDEDGMPIAYAKPSLVNRGYADDGIPEEVWEYAARWWAEANGRQYDEAMSGRVNAARLYDEIITANSSKTVHGRHFRQLDGSDRAGLTSVSDFAAVDDDTSSDDVNLRNALNGGEAYGYAKMLFNVKRVVGGKAQSLLLDRIASYSKTLSVQHSAFFPIATKMESPAAAVGFWTMMASNFTPESARKLDSAAKNFDRLFHTHFSDTINRDFVGFKDILEMMDTNDPFLAEAVNICTALGISLSTRLSNPAEEDKAQVEADVARLADAARGFLGDEGAQFVKGVLDGFLFRGSERAFTYALNATKIATALQIAQVCRRKCREEGRAFNLVREVKPYAAYINAEVGGIDPMRYAWANPRFRKWMSRLMFSWEWTKGAWSAGGGEIIETALGGGHFTTPEARALMWGRWLRMYGSVMVGVPMAFQAAIKLISLCLGGYEGDDDDPWWTWQNERKIGLSAFNLTPLLKTVSKSETLMWLKDKPLIGALLPAYTGKDHYNTSGDRKIYQHFGKQGWEFFRWFDHSVEQFLSKLSMPIQRIMEGLLGYNPASREYDLPMSKHSFAARWLNPFLQTGREGAWFNLLSAFVPFSWNAMGTYGDAGVLPALGPVSMGSSYMANIKDAQDRLTAWALNDRSGYVFGGPRAGKNKKLLASRLTDIAADARKNGMDPKTVLAEATGLAAKELYKRLFDLLPKEPGADVDVRAISRIARGLNRLGATQSQVMQSLKSKFGRRGTDWERMPAAQRVRIRSIVGETMRNPYTADEESVKANTLRNLRRLGLDLGKGMVDY